MKIKSIKAITLSMPFSHGGKKVIFHGKGWKSLEFNLVKLKLTKVLPVGVRILVIQVGKLLKSLLMIWLLHYSLEKISSIYRSFF